MRKKDELAIDKILECAKQEFFEKGFEGSSMRTIAINAGYTTGMLYGRFADKDELFKAIVKDAADKLYVYYAKTQMEFASFAPEKQYKDMHHYVDSLIEIETTNTVRFIKELNDAGIKINDVRADLSHILATALFNGMFEVIEHDFAKEDARQYVKQLQYFFNAGWDKILGISTN